MSIVKVDSTLEHVIPRLEGWMSVEKGKRIARLIAACPPPVRCVELGVFGGRGIVAMGLALKDLGIEGSVDGVDPYTNGAALEHMKEKANLDWWSSIDLTAVKNRVITALAAHGLSNVHLVIDKSENVASRYADHSIDILHVDSNHSAEVAIREVELYADKIRPGGYCVADDIGWTEGGQETVAKGIEKLLKRGYVHLETNGTWAIYRAP